MMTAFTSRASATVLFAVTAALLFTPGPARAQGTPPSHVGHDGLTPEVARLLD